MSRMAPFKPDPIPLATAVGISRPKLGYHRAHRRAGFPKHCGQCRTAWPLRRRFNCGQHLWPARPCLQAYSGWAAGSFSRVFEQPSRDRRPPLSTTGIRCPSGEARDGATGTGGPRIRRSPCGPALASGRTGYGVGRRGAVRKLGMGGDELQVRLVPVSSGLPDRQRALVDPGGRGSVRHRSRAIAAVGRSTVADRAVGSGLFGEAGPASGSCPSVSKEDNRSAKATSRRRAADGRLGRAARPARA